MIKYFYLTMFIVLGSFQALFAQTKPKDTPKKDTTEESKKPAISYFKPKTTYLSNAVYNGRKDSVVVSYLSPGIEYADKSGFNVSASASYLVSGSVHRFDAFSLGLGNDFKITKNWNASLSADKDYYNDSSLAVQSASKGSLGADMSYDLDIVEIGTSGEMIFQQSSNQYGASITLSHGFDFGKEDTAAWTITPTFKANYGTQDFIHEHTRKKVKKKNQAANVKNSIVTNVISGSNAFSILDYEFSAPISFETKNWAFSFTPTYALPVNPITTKTQTILYQNGIKLPQNQQPKPEIEKENLSNTFFFELEVTWKIPTTKKNKK